MHVDVSVMSELGFRGWGLSLVARRVHPRNPDLA